MLSGHGGCPGSGACGLAIWFGIPIPVWAAWAGAPVVVLAGTPVVILDGALPAMICAIVRCCCNGKMLGQIANSTAPILKTKPKETLDINS